MLFGVVVLLARQQSGDFTFPISLHMFRSHHQMKLVLSLSAHSHTAASGLSRISHFKRFWLPVLFAQNTTGLLPGRCSLHERLHLMKDTSALARIVGGYIRGTDLVVYSAFCASAAVKSSPCFTTIDGILPSRSIERV